MDQPPAFARSFAKREANLPSSPGLYLGGAKSRDFFLAGDETGVTKDVTVGLGTVDSGGLRVATGYTTQGVRTSRG